ncbi:MAG: glycosyltransferase family 4 protein [Actinomycetota bacterium]
MRVLWTTQVVDPEHPLLGFSHSWISGLAQLVDTVDVIALSASGYDLPSNVTVRSLGKETGAPRWLRFLRYQWLAVTLVLRKKVDVVFVQQTEINVLLLAPYALVQRIPIVIFKAHSQSLRPSLKVATKVVKKAVTSTATAFPIDTPKKLVIGQGIDVARFTLPTGGHLQEGRMRIVSVGRLSPIKRYDLQIEAARLLAETHGRDSFSFHVYGSWDYPGYKEHLNELRGLIARFGLEDVFHFEGAVSFSEIPSIYHSADLVLHTCESLSLDKAVLEAMASGVPVVAPFEPYGPLLGPFAEQLSLAALDAGVIAGKLGTLLELDPDRVTEMGEGLREVIVRDHSVEHLTRRLVEVFQEVTGR